MSNGTTSDTLVRPFVVNPTVQPVKSPVSKPGLENCAVAVEAIAPSSEREIVVLKFNIASLPSVLSLQEFVPTFKELRPKPAFLLGRRRLRTWTRRLPTRRILPKWRGVRS